MRKAAIILIITAALAMYGCKSTGETENASVQNINTSDNENAEIQNASITAPENPEIGTEKNTEEDLFEIQAENVIYTEVSQGGPYGKISISLPDGWSYEACPIDSDDLMCGMYGIHFYPESAADGYIELVYMDWFSNQVMDILDTLSFDQNMREGGAYLYDEESDISEIGLYFTLKNDAGRI